MRTYIKLQAPYEWVKVDGKKVESFGEVASLDEYPLSDDNEIIGVVPGEWVTVQNVSIPAKSKKQFLLALPYALEELLSEEVEDTHFVCPSWKSGEDCNVLVVSKEKMREWQGLANTHRLPIERLVPDYALLPFHDAAEYSLARSGEQLLANNQAGSGASLDEEFVDIWLMDVPVASTIAVNDQHLAEQLIETNADRDIRHWPFGDKMAHWLEYLPDPKIDLWADKFRPSVRKLNWQSYVMPLVIVGIAVITKFGFDTYRYVALHSEIKSINAEMQDVIKSTFPQIDVVAVDEEHMIMQQAVARMGDVDKKQNMQAMLAEVSLVLRRQGVTIVNMTYRDERMEITCELKNFSQVEQLTQQLNARPQINADLQSSSADDGEIIASYTIKHT